MSWIVQVMGEAVNSRGRLPHVPTAIRSGSWRRTATVLGALLTATGMVGLATWVGCSIYNPSLLLPGASESGADVVVEAPVTSDAGDAGADGPPPPCAEVFPPTKPAQDDPSDANDQSFVVALHTLDLGFGGDAGTSPASFGYDLDLVYTCCDGGAESCKAASTGAQHCDENGGRDNSGGQLLGTLASEDPGQFNATTISQRLQNGTYTIMLQILHYNGQANDTQVTAALFTSDGIATVGDAAPPPTKWDGTDVWSIDQGSVLLADASPVVGKYADGVAYVSGGTLVMHVSFPISLGTAGTGSLSVDLTGGVLTGQVEPADAGTYRLTDGQIAGRWNVPELLGALQNLAIGSSYLCRGTVLYENVKGLICQAADIMTSPGDDKTGATCDAVSLAFGFTADPANIGEVVATPLKVSPCGDDAGDGAPDDCVP
jgi:hypothetical protein